MVTSACSACIGVHSLLLAQLQGSITLEAQAFTLELFPGLISKFIECHLHSESVHKANSGAQHPRIGASKCQLHT